MVAKSSSSSSSSSLIPSVPSVRSVPADDVGAGDDVVSVVCRDAHEAQCCCCRSTASSAARERSAARLSWPCCCQRVALAGVARQASTRRTSATVLLPPVTSASSICTVLGSEKASCSLFQHTTSTDVGVVSTSSLVDDSDSSLVDDSESSLEHDSWLADCS